MKRISRERNSRTSWLNERSYVYWRHLGFPFYMSKKDIVHYPVLSSPLLRKERSVHLQ